MNNAMNEQWPLAAQVKAAAVLRERTRSVRLSPLRSTRVGCGWLGSQRRKVRAGMFAGRRLFPGKKNRRSLGTARISQGAAGNEVLRYDLDFNVALKAIKLLDEVEQESFLHYLPVLYVRMWMWCGRTPMCASTRETVDESPENIHSMRGQVGGQVGRSVVLRWFCTTQRALSSSPVSS